MKRPPFTIGIEEEYQTVDPVTFDLRSHIATEIVHEGKRRLKEKVKAEMHQSVIEVGTGVCRTVREAADDLFDLRRQMIERANGGMTVPQVFIDGRHIGGSDDLAALDATRHHRTTARNREHVLNRHQERLINRASRLRNELIHRLHQRQNRVLAQIVVLAFQRCHRRTADDRRRVAREFILVQQVANFHLHQLKIGRAHV